MMRLCCRAAVAAVLGIVTSPAAFAATPTWHGGELSIDNPPDSVLRGRDARLQLVVTGRDDQGRFTDVTRHAEYQLDRPGVVRVEQGVVLPLADGSVTIRANFSGSSAAVNVRVVNTGDEPQISFPSRIVPIFTKLGCNGGGCHGKAAGQNGFKLSLLGFEPGEDYEHLIRESRGRRVSQASPDQSLLLLKAINQSPHGGGQRMDRDSHEYRMVRRWIAQGTPYGRDDEPVVTSIEVIPSHRRLAAESHQQLSVVARYSDGRAEDVTTAAVYESNDKEMADVSERGLVQLQALTGDVAVMARYQGHVTVFRADIPLTDASTSLPETLAAETDNVVDRHVFAKLVSLGIPPSPPCDDATFLRRVTLDVTGRLPTLQETESFDADPSPDKRSRLVDRLLDSPDYADYFAGKWNAILRNKRGGGELRFANVAFHQWIRDSLADNKPYDQFVREIVTASGSVASHPPVVWYQQVPDTNQRIEDAAQLFLGQRIQCARCHHHPYEKWSQKDYAQLSAFFSTVSQEEFRRSRPSLPFLPVCRPHPQNIPRTASPFRRPPLTRIRSRSTRRRIRESSLPIG